MSKQPIPVHQATSAEDHARLGIKSAQMELWEDGRRTDGGKGSYEWWYLDAYLDGGAKLVIVFHTKPLADVGGPLRPYVEFALDRADGTHFARNIYFPPGEYAAASDRCDVRIGPNTFQGDLHTYQVHIDAADVAVDLTLTGTVPPWRRPETTCLFFGERGEHTFAWIPAVPQGDVTGTITIAGQRETVRGIGYHDHNWGNISPAQLLHHWYWARGKVGDYTIIVSHITAEKRYGYKPFTVFMLAHKGQIMVDDASKVRFAARNFQTDAETGKPVAQVLTCKYQDDTRRYRLTFTRQETILRIKLITMIPGVQAFLARLIGFDGAFLRFTGELAIEHYEGDRLVAAEHDPAIWEMMYFGHAPDGGVRDEG